MKTVKQFFKNLWKDESAQGATEYIILLVVVVAIVLLFRDQIQGLVQGRLDELGGSLESVTGFN